MTTTPSALRYSCDYETVLKNPYGRHRIFVDQAAKGRRILELGCADGFISRHLKERGCQITGIEIVPQAAEQARQWCDKVVIYDLNRPDWPGHVDAGYDTVLCGDVLEHLVNPELVLKQVREILSPGGRVLVCVPNIAHLRIRLRLLFGRFEYESTGIMDMTHLRFYTYSTARKMIESAGFQIQSYHPMLGGGALTHWFRRMFHTLFAGNMLFVAVRAR